MSFTKHLEPYRLSKTTNRYKGIGQVLLGWLLIAFTLVLNKLVSKRIPSSEILFLQFSWMSVALLPYILWKGFSYLVTENWIHITLRGIIAAVGYYFFVVCGRKMGLVDNSLLFNTEALFVPWLLWLAYRKKIDRLTWIGIVIGFIGVAAVYRPDITIANIAAFLGLGAGLATAIVVLLTSIIMRLREPPIRVATYHAIIACIIFGLESFHIWETPQGFDLLYAGGSGICFAVAICLFIHAFYHTEPHIIGGLSYSLVVFSGILDWVIFGDIPSQYSMIGFVLILIGGVLIIYKSHQKNKTDRYFI